METEVKCFIAVNEQPETQPTYVGADCTLLVDDNDSGAFFGVKIPCELEAVNRDTVEACVNTSQGIRVTITVGGEDVSDSIIGKLSIKHDLNRVSTFSFQLGDPKYSPLVDSYIAVNSVVIITAYINGQEIKMFTGLVDGTRTSYDGGYKLTIYGRDYGKKLLDTTKTLISVQESAANHLVGIGWIAALDQYVDSTYRAYRSDIIKYIAEQGGITDIGFPGGEPVGGFFNIGGQKIPYMVGYPGDEIKTDHSFQDQNLWNMIQKECAIEGWFVRFDENGVMQVTKKSLKTTADWEYGEDKFTQLGLETSDKGIINKVIILGAIFEEETITTETNDTEVDVPEVEYSYTEYSFTPSFEAGEIVGGWSEGDATIKVTATYEGFVKPLGEIYPTAQIYKFTISGSDSGKIKGLSFSVTGGASKSNKGTNYVTVLRTGLFI